jgi:LPS sulfotransferase NodH
MVPLAQRLGVISDGRLNVMHYMQALTRVRTSANGVFGVKAHFSQFAPFQKNAMWRTLLPGQHKFICIERDDELGQAISLAIARQTDCYSSESQPAREPQYDRNLIENSLQMIRSDKQGWRAFFRQNDIEPAETTYEELIASPVEVCTRLCRGIGIEISPACFQLGRTGLKKQANEINTAWRQRYVEEIKADVANMSG